MSNEFSELSNFITEIIDKDLAAGKNSGRVHTRFPPEPNGYLHIGHAKSICLNFGITQKYSQGLTNLRFDDTNPVKEDTEYVDSIKEDVKWLGFNWEDREYFASDYFDKLYDFAVQLIKKGKAYVCSLNAEQTKEYRGNWNEPGKNSPDRERSIEDNLALFEQMKAGEFEDGKYTLRAKIDMAAGNMNLRDPAIYRIRKVHHHKTGDKWNIYPMYDFAHGLSDAIENITHSICTLEFEDHRPLYNWFLEELEIAEPPQQIEFARLNLTYTMMSKRKLLQLVEEGIVRGWDDPRMPTISGLRRRGYTSSSIRKFCERIGVAKDNSTVDIALLHHFIRDELNQEAQRAMVVFDPLKVVIDNYPEDQVEEMDGKNHPQQPEKGTRKVPFSKTLYIEKEDFMEDAPKKFFRLSLGREVRFLHGYYLTCTRVEKDPETGDITELGCTYDEATRGGFYPERKVKGSIHWVSADQAVPCEVRLYDHLFDDESPDIPSDGSLKETVNSNSERVIQGLAEPFLKDTAKDMKFQFLRQGYFCHDSKDSSEEKLVFNEIVSLKDSYKP